MGGGAALGVLGAAMVEMYGGADPNAARLLETLKARSRHRACWLWPVCGVRDASGCCRSERRDGVGRVERGRRRCEGSERMTGACGLVRESQRKLQVLVWAERHAFPRREKARQQHRTNSGAHLLTRVALALRLQAAADRHPLSQPSHTHTQDSSMSKQSGFQRRAVSRSTPRGTRVHRIHLSNR